MKYNEVNIKIEKLPDAKDLNLPTYQTIGAAGADVVAAETVELKVNERKAVRTGLILEIPEGFEVQVRPRSGLALKHGITVLNSPGTIDSDYRGEVKVILVNLGNEPFVIKRGERIAQLVVMPVIKAKFIEDTIDYNTSRGKGGFGSTGLWNDKKQKTIIKKKEEDHEW